MKYISKPRLGIKQVSLNQNPFFPPPAPERGFPPLAGAGGGLSVLTTFLLLFLSFTPGILQSQTTTIKIDPTVKRTLSGVSELDRSKYFNIHSRSNDADLSAFYDEYNVTFSGRGFWSPSAIAKQQTGHVGVFPSYVPSSDGVVREVSRFVATDHPRNVYKEGIDIEGAANWAVHYYKNETGPSGRPEFFEPMNEPFVHARDFYDEPDWTSSAEKRVKEEMARLYKAFGQKIHEAPELANMKVIGYSSAYPALERKDFEHWEINQKMFFDIAGDHMDGFATHLYDGINVTGQDSKRSGSNSEAILDLIETYSYVKWDSIKPHAITEFGGIESGYPAGYSDVKWVQTVRSINHILFNLLERQDRLHISIPFIGDKATWHINANNNYQPYGSVLFKATNIGVPLEQIEGWEYTSKVLFFKLWQDVKGERVLIRSNNPDIQAQAFLDNNVLFVALNNLDDFNQTVNLEMLSELPEVSEVRKKSLKIYKDVDPVYTDVIEASAPTSLTLIPGETVMLAYTLAEPVAFENTINRERYYTKTHLLPIQANSEMMFQFNGVDAGTGYAILKMSIGRKHNRSKSPVVKINGQTVAVPDNWKGYDQANRDDFFGMIDIPVPMSLLQENNTVSITFPDSGGHLSSVILQGEKFETPRVVSTSAQEVLEALSVYPNPFSDQLSIELPEEISDSVTVSFFNASGKNLLTTVREVYGNRLEVRTGSLPRGFYLVRVATASKVFVGKVEKF